MATGAALGTGMVDRPRRGTSVIAGRAAGGRRAHAGARGPGTAVAEADRGNQPPANLASRNAPVLDLKAVGGLSITEIYDDEICLQITLKYVGVAQRERNRLYRDGFTTIKEVIDHYRDDLKGFRTHLETLNITFATDPIALVYFTPLIISAIVEVFHYFNAGVSGLHKVPDALLIDREKANQYGRHFKLSFGLDDDSDDDEDLINPPLTGASDWISFRDAFISKL